jgi:hypothetical protein
VRKIFAPYNHLTMTRRTLLGIAGIAVVIALAVAGLARWGLHGPAHPDPAACLRLATHAERAQCLDPYFHEAVRSGLTRETLHSLTDFVRAGVLDDCHQLAHDFGHIAFEVTGRLPIALREGSAACLNGYYHGVVEAAVQQAATEGKLRIVELCKGVRPGGPAYDACVHGLGHGLMHVFNDVLRSLQGCSELADDYARDRCVGGVYMQNSMRYLDLDDAGYRAAAPRACDDLALPPDDLAQCFGQIGEIAMFYYRHDLHAALEICRAVGSGGDAAACERGAREELETSRLERRPG